MFGKSTWRTEAQREELGVWLQQRLGGRRAHLVWIVALVVLAAYLGVIAWVVIVPLLAQWFPAWPALGPLAGALLAIIAGWVVTVNVVPDTEPWARAARRVARTVERLGELIDDGLAILVGFVFCLVLVSQVAPGMNALVGLAVALVIMAAVVWGWRWSAASRAWTPRPSTALTIASVALLALAALYVAANRRL